MLATHLACLLLVSGLLHYTHINITTGRLNFLVYGHLFTGTNQMFLMMALRAVGHAVVPVSWSHFVIYVFRIPMAVLLIWTLHLGYNQIFVYIHMHVLDMCAYYIKIVEELRVQQQRAEVMEMLETLEQRRQVNFLRHNISHFLFPKQSLPSATNSSFLGRLMQWCADVVGAEFTIAVVTGTLMVLLMDITLLALWLSWTSIQQA